MHRILRLLAASLCLTLGLAPAIVYAMPRSHDTRKHPAQETGFLNRKIQVNGATYRYQVYLPEEWRRDDRKEWPVILFLHGRGERGAEGMWQTQIGLPQAIRDHPERWPFIVVMPQCAQGHFWTDPDMLAVSLAALDEEIKEFHADPARTYLSGLSMGGYGAWELARLHPSRWAAVVIAAGGVFWSYSPDRWLLASSLLGEYAQAISHTPIWLFHGAEDNIVAPRQSELMFSAFKASGGHIRLWVYQGLKHDCWTRAFNEPELPRWLLQHRLGTTVGPTAFAERISIPLHPPAIRLTSAQLESFAGDYFDSHGVRAVTLFRQGDLLYQKNQYGEIAELAAESPSTLFYPSGSSLTRIVVERDTQGHISGLIFRDDRHEEHWERIRPGVRIHSQSE
jgi:poly(3-hydroxybutyrate) depolymerase